MFPTSEKGQKTPTPSLLLGCAGAELPPPLCTSNRGRGAGAGFSAAAEPWLFMFQGDQWFVSVFWEENDLKHTQ